MKAIITFHSIDASQSVLSFHPDIFLNFVQALVNAKIPIVTLETLLQDNVSRGVSLTFDDGMQSVFTNALPIIKDFNIPAHLFLTTSSIGGYNDWPGQAEGGPKYEMMSWDQIQACQDGGISIEAHTQTHPKLNQVNAEELEEECHGCDSIIEQRLGKKPEYFAYPFGIYNETALEFARSRYRASVTTFLRPLKIKEDLAALPRLDSYYLQSSRVHSTLDHPLTQAYIMSRSLIRSIRKHQ